MSSKLLQDSFDGIEGVYGRRLRLCSYLESHETSDLILSCSHCSHFYLLCCSCRKSYRPCHRYRLVFTDGACRNNGQTGATAGIGIAYGTDEQSQIVLPISDKLDNFPRRTSQRAELLAALKGLSQVCENDTPLINDSPGGYLIIATDSEYVVNGITQWFPRWKVSIYDGEIPIIKLNVSAGQ